MRDWLLLTAGTFTGGAIVTESFWLLAVAAVLCVIAALVDDQ